MLDARSEWTNTQVPPTERERERERDRERDWNSKIDTSMSVVCTIIYNSNIDNGFIMNNERNSAQWWSSIDGRIYCLMIVVCKSFNSKADNLNKHNETAFASAKHFIQFFLPSPDLFAFNYISLEWHLIIINWSSPCIMALIIFLIHSDIHDA